MSIRVVVLSPNFNQWTGVQSGAVFASAGFFAVAEPLFLHAAEVPDTAMASPTGLMGKAMADMLKK